MKLTQKIRNLKEKITSKKIVVEARNTRINTTVFNAKKTQEQISQDVDTLYIYNVLEKLPSFSMNKDNQSGNYRHGKMTYFDNNHNATEFKSIVEKSTGFKVVIV